jgi:hypothetical protein
MNKLWKIVLKGLLFRVLTRAFSPGDIMADLTRLRETFVVKP